MTPALPGLGMEDPTNTVAHLIQTALTPVFLLSGIGVLLGVFNTRLARVSDHMAHATDLLRGAARPEEEAKLRVHLRRLASHANAGRIRRAGRHWRCFYMRRRLRPVPGKRR